MKLTHFLLSLMAGAAAWSVLVLADPQRFHADDEFALGLLMFSSGAIGLSIAFAHSRAGRYLLIYLAAVCACAGVTNSLLLLVIGLLPGCGAYWYLQRRRPDILDNEGK